MRFKFPARIVVAAIFLLVLSMGQGAAHSLSKSTSSTQNFIPLVAVADQSGVITGLVWFDDLGSVNYGYRGPGEGGQSGFTVTLRHSGGGVIGSQVTTITGLYTFTNLYPGDYVVEFSPPFGFRPGSPWGKEGRYCNRFTWQQFGNDRTVDSDPDPVTGKTRNITLSKGQMIASAIDAGYVFCHT